ncbi:hypothetical protein MFIFM68171_10418 [Madurella fahalii]|uniref:Zn(2)-C6 fungal-type domain-containing protein n=1 Tax=Madurella fahalii TaxID=1157608 RepID=A0ABQ0GR41_9PEZI
MASVASASLGASPVSPYDFDFPAAPAATEPTGEELDDEAFWTVINNAAAGGSSIGTGTGNGSGPASVGFISSPSAHSLGSSWAVIGHGAGGGQHPEQPELSPAALSPGLVDSDLGSGQSFPERHPQEESVSGDRYSHTATDGNWTLFAQSLARDLTGELLGPTYHGDLAGLFNAGIGGQQQPVAAAFDFENPQLFQGGVDVPPWGPLSSLRVNSAGNDAPVVSDTGMASVVVMEDPNLITPSPPASHRYSPSLHSASVSPPASAPSPRSPAQQVKREPASSPPEYSKPPAPTTASSSSTTKPTTTPPIQIRKANTSNRVQKRKSPASASPTTSSSSDPSPTATQSKFLIVTPSSISAHSHKPNPFECFEALRPSQRGRKGPLATDTKQSALQVRRMGACFSCHARKVRCDKERPCRSCVRLAQQVPQVVCWQFSDFTGILFPEFIRGHLRKEAVGRFVGDTVECFMDQEWAVEMYSGYGLAARLVVPGVKFFTARSVEALQHWHLRVGVNNMDLQAHGAAPIGLEVRPDGWEGQRNEMRKRMREYVQAIAAEPDYAELVTQAPQHTLLPRKLLRIVHDYANRCDVAMVKRALTIYTMHYVMTRHLCLTERCVTDLAPTGLVPQGVPFVTSRVLNRQIKAVLDEMLCQEVQKLFENFSKSLKPKLRSEWAPCLASFLVLCLIMESIETAADTFVISENEINLQRYYPPKWKRSFVLKINGEIENMPFKQFAFQFHQIYQTHSRDAAARSFNPLLDDTCFEQAELDRDAEDMVRKLRRFVDEDWAELDFLTADPILPNTEDHPYPRNVGYNYTGRLVAKFLLSFTDERYILDRKT